MLSRVLTRIQAWDGFQLLANVEAANATEALVP